ncbi:MAG TPA: peroxiredoxin [Candidatus Acidoferrales bacterium]|nr:peroxiredoxin [Candidatus Acidoferrales bacterium]
MPISRNSRSRFLLFSVLIAAVLVCAYPVLRAADPPAAGSAAPDFKLTSQEGATVSLHDFKGRWVVLYFYPKDFTSGCTIEAHNFQRDLAEYEKRHAVILGVSVDTADSHKQFCTKEGLNFKLLADTEHTVSTTYGSTMEYSGNTLAARNTFLIDPKGTIAKVFLKVHPDKHSEEVIAALDELQKAAK